MLAAAASAASRPGRGQGLSGARRGGALGAWGLGQRRGAHSGSGHAERPQRGAPPSSASAATELAAGPRAARAGANPPFLLPRPLPRPRFRAQSRELKAAGVKFLFIESICNDLDVLQRNYLNKARPGGGGAGGPGDRGARLLHGSLRGRATGCSITPRCGGQGQGRGRG
jgi:hypothetical protein